MPGIDSSASAHAMRGMPLVRALLIGAGAELACFHFELARRHNGYRCTMWRASGGGYDLSPSGRNVTRGVLSEVCGSLAPLARNLSARWPEQARPRIIGVATDGHAILFNADQPSGEGVDWLEQHIRGRSPGVLLAGDVGTGAFARMCSI